MAVTTATSEDGRDFLIHLRGDIDISAEPSLAPLLETIAQARCANVYLDLADINFAGATLIHFVEHLCSQLPADVTVTLCRPSPLTERLLDFVRLREIVVVRSGLPHSWRNIRTPTDGQRAKRRHASGAA
jgi:anti-anti-sigma factor